MASLLMLSMHFPSVELLNSHNTDHAWVLLQWYYHTDEGCRQLDGQEPTMSGSTFNLYSANTPTHYYPSVS